jgi:hypothetical protein
MILILLGESITLGLLVVNLLLVVFWFVPTNLADRRPPFVLAQSLTTVVVIGPYVVHDVLLRWLW